MDDDSSGIVGILVTVIGLGALRSRRAGIG